jgi:hypothetical protein
MEANYSRVSSELSCLLPAVPVDQREKGSVCLPAVPASVIRRETACNSVTKRTAAQRATPLHGFACSLGSEQLQHPVCGALLLPHTVARRNTPLIFLHKEKGKPH